MTARVEKGWLRLPPDAMDRAESRLLGLETDYMDGRSWRTIAESEPPRPEIADRQVWVVWISGLECYSCAWNIGLGRAED
jgi:hypothetical protein